MLRCRELVYLVTGGEPAAVPLRRRVAVRVHLLMCGHCRAYVRSLERLRILARALWRGIPAADPERLARLRDSLHDEPWPRLDG